MDPWDAKETIIPVLPLGSFESGIIFGGFTDGDFTDIKQPPLQNTDPFSMYE